MKTSAGTGIVNPADKQIKLNQLIFHKQENSTNQPVCLSFQLLIRIDVEEDEITYISVHDIFRPNNYIVIAKSYPGSQGDRAILPQKDKGRSQLRVFVDIIAYLPDKHTNLQENKPVFSNKSIQSDIDKLSLFKSNKEYRAALETFLLKYDSEAPKHIKIGVGFWANNRFTVQHIQALNIDDLDYFVYINAARTHWKIFSTGNEQLFSITEGKVNVPLRYKLKKYKAEEQNDLF